MGSSWMTGFLYATSAGLLPIFALPYLNEDYSAASRTVAWLATGELMLPLLIGWLADKYDKRNLMILLTFIAILVLFLIPVFFHLPCGSERRAEDVDRSGLACEQEELERQALKERIRLKNEENAKAKAK